MKCRKFMSALLAAAMVFTSVPAVSVSAAETEVPEQGLVASYDFNEESLVNSVTGIADATAIVTGLGSYSGTVAYGESRDGTKAITLGNYGLKLNKQNLGETFTVSMWLQATASIASNQNVLFLGYHAPEIWYSVAGRSTSNNRLKTWAYGNGYSWTEMGTFNVARTWHLLTITDDGETTKTYLDGSEVISNGSNKPLSGSNQDIYVGVNYWDPEFVGLVDDVKVYNRALSVAEIQQLDEEIYAAAEAAFNTAWGRVSLNSIIGGNASADQIMYDLDLFKEAAGGSVVWTSSNPDVIAADGTVAAPKEATKVTMTAKVTCGSFTGEKSIELTVLPLDKASLDELIIKAESLDLGKYTQESAAALTAAIKAAKEVNKQEVVDIATTDIYVALSELKYKDAYKDPFAVIDEAAPEAVAALTAGESAQLFTLPEEVKDYVSVEYISSNDAAASYKDGKVTVLKDERTTVTVIITADYNGYKEEYSTVISAEEVPMVLSIENRKANAAEVTLKDPTEGPLYIKESSIHQLLTEDFTLPATVQVEGAAAQIEYTLENANEEYVTLEGNTLKINRPFGGDGNYTFVVTAEIQAASGTVTQQFPFTIAEGITEDTFAGYVYLCFGNRNGADVQQVHMFLSEDGLNWTAVNGFNPAFEAGKDFKNLINDAGTHNYTIAAGADISKTTSGDASVLFPFEGDDQGIRDPYILRGEREDDKDKVWILATDLNTMSSQYGGNLNNNTVGNWGTMSSRGSTNIFIYETEDFINWERRYVDVGSEIGAGAAWAPEAVYNPEKDNYLVYWSCRVAVDGRARNRVYCNETEDFVTFGPTKLYEEEPFYANWIGKNPGKADDGFGNIDTSQLWVADEDGNPYGTLYRLVKDETNNHIELMRADTVLDPNVNYDNSNPIRITPYTLNGKTFSTTADFNGAGLTSHQRAEVVYNWFINESTGNHFEKVSQSYMESRNASNGAYEGATMFKFNDRDEWCVMIDNYSSSSIRYEPYVTYDLGEPDSITKVTSGYGRTGGDVGCHGGMMPITAAEYNAIIDTYNADPSVSNYHPIDYIEIDKRQYQAAADDITAILENGNVDEETKATLEENLIMLEAIIKLPIIDTDAADAIIERVNSLLNADEIELSKTSVGLSLGQSAAIAAEGSDLEWYSADKAVATVEDGTIKAEGLGSTFVFVRSGRAGLEFIKVTVTAGAELPYTDLEEGAWYYDAVSYAFAEGIMTGKNETTFAPADTMTRAELATMLYRLAGKPGYTEEAAYPDLEEGAWYLDAVNWASENGIVTGYLNSGLFDPHGLVTREQTALMLYRYATKYAGEEVDATADLSAYEDAASISEYAEVAMKWAVGAGIITGRDGKLLAPQGTTLRVEGANIIYKYMN